MMKGEPVLLPDGAGLYLRKQSASGTAWTLRYRFGGRDRWMALGSYPDMELAEARKAARAKRTLVDSGRDPQGVYNTRDYFAERKVALETWTTLLLEIERGERKVTPKRSRRSNLLTPELGKQMRKSVAPGETDRDNSSESQNATGSQKNRERTASTRRTWRRPVL